MARKPLRSQLNQIRAWVRQGRTDAWIAHQLDVSASELSEFRRRHDLSPDAEDSGEIDLRDEIEAEIEAAAAEEELAVEDEDEEPTDEHEEAPSAEPDERSPEDEEEPSGDEEARPRRRRRRRGGRGKRAGAGLQATFDHGEKDGYGLWLDPAVTDDPVYGKHWAGHRQVEVTIEPDQIVIRRS